MDVVVVTQKDDIAIDNKNDNNKNDGNDSSVNYVPKLSLDFDKIQKERIINDLRDYFIDKRKKNNPPLEYKNTTSKVVLKSNSTDSINDFHYQIGLLDQAGINAGNSLLFNFSMNSNVYSEVIMNGYSVQIGIIGIKNNINLKQHIQQLNDIVAVGIKSESFDLLKLSN